ncbi:histidine kinase [Hydrogenophaga crassostreae]|uniref:Histidine kinase n=2 Tax=Hydrogenophaga crassostreae TaxID=1763535 RepID=A0A162SVD8_9BURK|nr:sensor histidine kinase [Hydrogenophaga crassostreae]OAD40667.1 histidine kinase [Hydrogenophaga crassostreae]
MQDSRILSTFQDLASAPGKRPLQDMPALPSDVVLVFDTCQAGVVLRAVLFVEAIVCVAALFGVQSLLGWVGQVALLTGAALPAVLLWLLAVCGLKRLMARWSMPVQTGVGVLLGGFCSFYGFGLLVWMGLVGSEPWLAASVAGMLVAAVLVTALIWRAKAREPAGTAARLAELQARIRPHFLFNTLNSAIALVREEPAKAESLLEDLSELFRHALAGSNEAVPLHQELDLAHHYLAIEKVRFGDRLQIEWSLDESASSAMLPPLILQPLVENAVKHGVEPSPTGAVVRISTKRRGSVVVIKVTNTVPAGSGVKGNGLALDNVRQRLALLHDMQGQFQSALVDNIFQVRLEIPL